jgi:hypothetical protein
MANPLTLLRAAFTITSAPPPLPQRLMIPDSAVHPRRPRARSCFFRRTTISLHSCNALRVASHFHRGPGVRTCGVRWGAYRMELEPQFAGTITGHARIVDGDTFDLARIICLWKSRPRRTGSEPGSAMMRSRRTVGPACARRARTVKARVWPIMAAVVDPPHIRHCCMPSDGRSTPDLGLGRGTVADDRC